MAVHFKFRSSVEYDSLNIDGHFISIANLKEKIVEQKRLGKGTDFDLVIANSQTGEEYTDDNQLLPKNTSVIIKRVPATRSKPTLQVHDQVKADVSEQTSGADSKFTDDIPSAGAVSNAELDDMDDFGVDLYSVPDPVPTQIDTDENNKVAGMVNKTTSDWDRLAQDAFGAEHGYGRGVYGRSFARGYTYGRAIPPQGYTCHCCGQTGHFIQHCPTNADPAYDRKRMNLSAGITTKMKVDEEGSYILPDGSVVAMPSDVTAFAKETDALLILKPAPMEPPAELRCPLCQGIFKEAVMIPCCHYSFCDICIRQALIDKGECPQCGSPTFKNDDLLPNIALQQAIDHFLEAQQSTTSAEDTADKQQVPDVESASQAKASSPTLLGVKIELHKSIATNATASGAEMVEKEQNLAVTAESACESAIESRENNVIIANTTVVEAVKALAPVNILHNPDKSDAVDSPATKQNDNVVDHTVAKAVSHLARGGGKKQPVSHIGESAMGSKMFEPPSQKEVEGVALESELSKGKKMKKRAHLVPADGLTEHLITSKPRKGDRFCYVCGSPDHLARDCIENNGSFHLHRGMLRSGVPTPPNGMPPYSPEMYWHGPPVPHVRPFPLGYGEGMYGPSPMGMPFEAPMIHVGPYGIPPYMPPIYHTTTMHAGFMGGIGPTMMFRMERPLSREEFLELQERERRRRLTQEHPGREHSQEGQYSRVRGGQANFPDSEKKLYDQRRLSMDEHLSLSRKRELDQLSVRNYSDESDHYRINGSKHGRKIEKFSESHGRWMCESASDEEITYDDSKSRRSHVEGHQQGLKALYSEVRKEIRYHHQISGENLSSELEDGEQSCSAEVRDRSSRKEEHMRLSNHSSQKRYGDCSSKRHGDTSSKRHADASSRKYRCGSIKKYDDRSIYTEVMSVEDSHHRSKMSISEDSRHVSERSDVWKNGKYECLENREWYSSHDYSDYDDDNAKDGEICKRRSNQCHSKSKSNPDTVDYKLEDVSTKKKKKTHRKHREDSQEMDQDVNYDFLEDGVVEEPSKHRKNKSNNTFSLLAPSFQNQRSRQSSQMLVSSTRSPIEESRWQLDSGFDGEDNFSHNSHWSRHK